MSTDNPQTMPVEHIRFEDLRIGLARDLTWKIQPSDLDKFAALSGDVNPLHVSKAFAVREGFQDRVAHGFLLGAKVSAFLGTVMPGRDCLLLESQLSWPAPCFAGDEVSIRGELVDLSTENRIIRVKIRATVMRGEDLSVVGRGWALCQIRS